MKRIKHKQYWQVIVDDNNNEITLFNSEEKAREAFNDCKNEIIHWSPSEIIKTSEDEFVAKWNGIWDTTIRSVKIKSVLVSINSQKDT